MASTDKELEQQLVEAGNKLVNPPASVDSLLELLDQVEQCLSKVEQSPSESMHSALSPSLKALVEDQLFKHSNLDVRVAVASCISEITRITAPDAPYDDDRMKDVFQLIVSSFENMADNSSRSYGKRTSILETVAKVRSCVVMLDLECDQLIIEMFQHFLKAIRDYHSESVFSSMETIMSLVLEESEDISEEVLYPLLTSVKKENEEVPPVARRLGEKVLKNCVEKVKPYLINAVRSLGASVNSYSDIVASICDEISGTIDQNDVQAADENKNVESKPVEALSEEDEQAVKEAVGEASSIKQADPAKDVSPKLGVSNGVTQVLADDSLEDSNSLKKEESGNCTNHSKKTDMSNNDQSNTLDEEKVVIAESKLEENIENKETVDNVAEPAGPPESSAVDADTVVEDVPDDKNLSKDTAYSPHEHPSVKEDVSCVNKNESGSQPSSPKVLEGDSVTVASPSASGSLTEENISEKAGCDKKKDSLIKDPLLSSDDVPKKTTDGMSDSEAKPQKRSGKKVPHGDSVEDKTPSTVDASKKENSTTSELESKSLKHSSKKVDNSHKNEDVSSLQQSDEKGKRGRRKVISEKNETKSSAKVDKKAKGTSPKSASNPKNDDHHMEETPLTSTKRKRAQAKDTVSDDVVYDENVVGAKVKVWWPKDRQYYEGVIDSFNPVKKKHKVVYIDGDKETLNLKKEKLIFIKDGREADEAETAEHLSADTSSETPVKKRMRSATKQGRADDSSLKKRGRTSSSKSTRATPQSAQKSKFVSKSDGKSVGDPKPVKKLEDDSGSKLKYRTPKSGSRTTDVASKSATKSKNVESVTSKSNKSKEDVTSTPKASIKIKQETPKTGKSKQDNTSKVISDSNIKQLKSAGKSNVNGTGKMKSGSAKVKEIEDEDISTDSDDMHVIAKVKSTGSSEVQGTDMKSGKKRRRED